MSDEERPRINLEVLSEGGASQEQVALAVESLGILMPCDCGAPGAPGMTCPFASEIHGEERECGCCDACANQCAMDI